MLKQLVALLILYIFILIGDEILGDYRFTQFLYKRLFACENEPLAWYKNSRFDLGNKASRGFFCSLNCGSNYRLSENSAFCERAPSNVPYYCPQPMLYSIYKGEIPSGQKKTISFFINNHPELSNNIKHIKFVDSKRWDLFIDEVKIQLGRHNLDQQLSLAYKILNQKKDIKILDMRIKNRIVITKNE